MSIMISLTSAILFLRLLMFKYLITAFLRYCKLHLRKTSRFEKQEWSKHVVCVWGHAHGVCAYLKNY